MWLHVPMEFKSECIPSNWYITFAREENLQADLWILIENYISIFKSGPVLVKQLPQHTENLQDFSDVRLLWWVGAVGDRGYWLFYVKT